MYNNGTDLREFGDFRLYADTKLLYHFETPVKLPEKALDVLIELTSQSGKIITREHLTSTLWGMEAGAENSLAQAIHSLRKMFRGYGHSDLIVTVPRRGYRFVGTIIDRKNSVQTALEHNNLPIQAVAQADGLNIQPYDQKNGEQAVLPSALPAPQVFQWQHWMILAVGILIILIAGFGIWHTFVPETGIGQAATRSIAVIPFRSEGDVDADLRLRLTDSLITRLSEIRQVRVRPLTAVKRYLDVENDPSEVGKQLKVDILFDGSVLQAGEVLRVELRAVSTDTGSELWKGQYVGERSRLLSLQDRISVDILEFLRSGGTQNYPELSVNLTEIPEAYEQFLKGRYFVGLRTSEGIRSSIEHFSRAIELDPTFAAAFVGLADAHFLLYDYNYDTSQENAMIAKEHVSTAIRLDPNNYAAFVLLGHIRKVYEWDWNGAAESYEAAFRIRSDSADAYHRRGMMQLKLREFDKAESDIRQALEIEPTSLAINMNLGTVLFFSGQHEQAIVQLRKVIGSEPRLAAPRWYLARCLWQMGNQTLALKTYIEALRITNEKELADTLENRLITDGPRAALGVFYEEWKKSGVNDHSLAILSSHRKDKVATLEHLKRVVDSRHPWSSSIFSEPEFEFVAGEHEFQELIEKLGVRKR